MDDPAVKSGAQRAGEIDRLRAELADARVQLSALQVLVQEQEISSRRIEQARLAWTQAFDALAQPVFIHDESHCIVRANRAYAEQAGLPVKNLIGKVYWKLFPILDGPFIAKDAAGGDSKFEFSPTPETTFLVQSVGAAAGLPPSWRMYMFHDVTEFKRVESTLRTSEQYARHVIDSSHAVIISVDRSRRIVEFNTAAEQAFGYRRDEVAGQSVNMLYADPAAGEAVGRRVLERDATVGEIVNRRKNGELFTSLLSASTLRDSEGKVLGVVGTSLEITDRKRAEDKLNAALTEFQLVFENAAVGIAHAKNRVIERVNHRFAEMLGYKIHELVGKSAAIAYPSRAHFEALGREAYPVLAQDQIYQTDAQFKRKDGSLVWVHLAGSAVESGKEAKESIWVVQDINDRKVAEVQDINDRKVAEMQHQRRAAYFRALVESSSHMISVVNANGDIRYESPALGRMLGAPASERIGKSILEHIHPEDVARVREGYGRILGGETQPAAFEFRLRRHDRTWRIVEGIGGGAFNVDGERVGLINLYDVAERRRSEDRLAQSMDGAIAAIAATAGMHDVYRPGHQQNVTALATAIARELGLDARRIQGLRLAANVHDVGMTRVPAEILAKPTLFDEVEHALVKTHSRTGYEILKTVDLPWPIADIVHQHHELLDGTGYPQRLKGDQILLEARIVAVADVVEAMASPRPYRPGLGVEAALAEIVRYRGVKYDAQAVDACVRLFREKNYVLAVQPAVRVNPHG